MSCQGILCHKTNCGLWDDPHSSRKKVVFELLPNGNSYFSLGPLHNVPGIITYHRKSIPLCVFLTGPPRDERSMEKIRRRSRKIFFSMLECKCNAIDGFQWDTRYQFHSINGVIKDDERGYLSNIPFPLGTHLSGNVTVISFLGIILMLNWVHVWKSKMWN